MKCPINKVELTRLNNAVVPQLEGLKVRILKRFSNASPCQKYYMGELVLTLQFKPLGKRKLRL